MANLAMLNGHAPPRVLVVIEEYGDLIQRVRMAHGRAAGHVDDMLDVILRGGRKLSMSLLFVDQYPEHWSQQVIAGTKWRAVYQLGPGQGAKLEEYHAARLPGRGVFLHRERQYRSWHVRPELPRLLAACSAPNAGVRLLGDAEHTERTAVPEAEMTSPNEFGTERSANGAGYPPPTPPNEPGRDAPKRELIRWWMEHVGGTQAEFRDWCRARGISVARGYVSEVFNEMEGGGKMKRVIVGGLFLLASAAVVRIGGELNSDALAMAVGVVLGVLATVPTALLVLAGERRRQLELERHHQAHELSQPERRVVVVLPDGRVAPPRAGSGAQAPRERARTDARPGRNAGPFLLRRKVGCA
ncbi:MAG: hypothetical protein KatS3mg051_2038 [Anaerolineae bacterium]|nr:MAG: hypothetical protein KatS3mg051_2038 [Anaerolineae bacterium]